jgi:uncharacterized protein YraI
MDRVSGVLESLEGIDAERIAGLTTSLDGGMSRRRLLRLMASAGAAAAAGGVLRALPAGAAGYGLKALSNLNLRSKPSLSGKVLLVIPKGAVVSDLGTSQNNFVKVKYNGKTGWAHMDFLGPTNATKPVWIGTGKLTSNVNFRKGPSTNDQVIEVLKKGRVIDITDGLWEGFRYVSVDGRNGWVFDEYIKQL